MSQLNNKGTVSASDLELQKIVKSFRVTELQALLVYAGRNKLGKKHYLQHRALELIKLHSASIEMKIKEIHLNRRQQRHPVLNDLLAMPTNKRLSRGDPYRAGSAFHGPPGYVQSINKQRIPSAISSNLPQYAVNPNVKFKELPFYEVLYELLRPTSLVPQMSERFHERELEFYFTTQQLLEMEQSCDVQVQLRFCLLETSCEQEDEFPSSVCLKINGKYASLPNPIPSTNATESKRPKQPVDISNVTNRTVEKNRISISWSSTTGRPYVVAVFLVRKQSSAVIISNLKLNSVRNPDQTTAMIKEKLCQDQDSEVATMSLRGSLICPLGKIKMQLPCRAVTCTHLQCFDATLYIQMNEKKPKWICPVCDKAAFYKDLSIDGLFLDIVSKAPIECTDVQFHNDGSWTPNVPVKEATETTESPIEIIAEKKVAPPRPKKPVAIEVINLDSDSDTEEAWPILPPKKRPCIVSMDLEIPESSVHATTSKEFDPYAPSVSNIETTFSDSTISNALSDNQAHNVESNDSIIVSPTPLSDNHNVESNDSIIVSPTPLSDNHNIESNDSIIVSSTPPEYTTKSPSPAATSSQTLDQPSAASTAFSDPLESLASAPNFDLFKYIDSAEIIFSPPLPAFPDVISIDD